MTPAQVKDFGNKLINLLTQQQLLYRQLQQLAQKHCSFVDGNPETLLKVLAGRQRLIDRLTAVDRDLQPLRADWQQMARMLPAEQRRQAENLVTSVKEILADILARDEQDSRTLAACQKEVADQIATASQGQRMNQAYAQAGSAPASRYFDSGAI